MANGEATDHTYYADSDIPFDSQEVTIGGKVFIFEDFTPTEGSHWVRSNKNSGAPRGGRHIADEIQANVMAQYPTGATDADTPKRFAVIVVKYRGADKNFVIQEVGQPQGSGKEKKVSLKIMELFNAPVGGS